MRVALLAGGTGGAKLAAGMQEEIGSDLSGHRQHRRRHRGARRPRLPRPRPRHLLALRRNRRGARLGHQGRHLHRLRAHAAARRAELVRALRPRPRRLPLPAPVHRRGRHARPTPRLRSPAASGSRRGCCRCPTRRCGPRSSPRLAPRPAGVPDPRRRRARGASGSSWRGSPRRRRRPPRCWRRCASAEAIVIGPSNPVISIGPILAVPGMREAIAAAPAPVVAVSPYVAGEVVKGPTDRFMRSARPPDHRRRRRLALRRPDRRHGGRRGRPRPAARRRPDAWPHRR